MARHLLEVVEDHQALATPRDRVPELNHRIVLAQRHVEPMRNRMHDAIQASRLGQIAEPDAARELSERVPPEPGDEPRLAGAAEAQDRDESRSRVEASRQVGQRLAAPDEGVALGRQAVPRL